MYKRQGCSEGSTPDDAINPSTPSSPTSPKASQALVVELTTPEDGSVVEAGIIAVKGTLKPYSRHLRLSVNGLEGVISPSGDFSGLALAFEGTTKVEVRISDMGTPKRVHLATVEVTAITPKAVTDSE